MKPTELFGKHLTFEAIDYFLRHRKQEVTPVFKIRIGLAKEICEEIIHGLDSILGGQTIFLTGDLNRQMLRKVYGPYEFSKREDIEGAKERFQETIKRLGNLEQNPKAFYEDVDNREMLAFVCAKMKDCYSSRLFRG